MSGSAAIAGARKRRTSNESASQLRDTKEDEVKKNGTPDNKTYSIVQVIQIHEARLKRLEENKISNGDTNTVSNVVDKKDKLLLDELKYKVKKLEGDIEMLKSESKARDESEASIMIV